MDYKILETKIRGGALPKHGFDVETKAKLASFLFSVIRSTKEQYKDMNNNEILIHFLNKLKIQKLRNFNEKDLDDSIFSLAEDINNWAKKEKIDLSISTGNLSKTAEEIYNLFRSMYITIRDETNTFNIRIKKLIFLLKEMFDKQKSIFNNLIESTESKDLFKSKSVFFADIENISDRIQEILRRMNDIVNDELTPMQNNILSLAADHIPEADSDLFQYLKQPEDIRKILRTLGVSATLMDRFSKVFKNIGITFEEFFDAKSWEDLEEKLTAVRLQINGEDKIKIESTINDLKKLFKMKSDAKISGGAEELDTNPIKTKAGNRILVIRNFMQSFKTKTDKFCRELINFSEHVKFQKRHSPLLLRLVQDFLLLTFPQTPDSYINLISMAKPYSPEFKKRFVDSVRVSQETLSKLIELKDQNNDFYNKLTSMLKEILDIIEYFSTVYAEASTLLTSSSFQKKYVKVSESGKPEELLVDVEHITYDMIPTYEVNPADVLINFSKVFYLAKTRESLSCANAIVEISDEGHKQILGLGVAAKIQEIRDKLANLFKSSVANKGLGPKPTDKAKLESWENLARYFIHVAEVRERFYLAIESIDILLVEFIKKSTAEPEKIAREIFVQMSQIKNINDSFSSAEGNNICSMFESTLNVNCEQSAVKEGQAHYYERVNESIRETGEISIGANFPNIKQTYAELQKKIAIVVDNCKILKNIMNIFSILVPDYTYMSIHMIHENLTSFIKQASIGVGLSQDEYIAGPIEIQDRFVNFNDPVDIGSCYYLTTINGITQTSWLEDLNILTYTIKGMCGKILTVMNIADMFKRPRSLADTIDTRVMLGGGIMVTEEAAPLYHRVPRIIEFVRDIFSIPDNKDYTRKIALIPENGHFTEIIKIIFNKSVDSNVYSDYEIQRIIFILNEIYNYFKTSREVQKDDIEREVYTLLIKELNQQYGAWRKTDLEEYYKSQKSLLRSTTDIMDSDPQILSTTIKTSARPSSIFSGVFNDNIKKKKSKIFTTLINPIDDPSSEISDRALLYDFNNKILSLLSNDKTQGLRFSSFKELIEEAQLKIKEATDPNEKLNIAIRLIQGGPSISGINNDQLVMFHETVINGIMALNAFYGIVCRLRTAAINLNVEGLEKGIIDFLRSNRNLTRIELINYLSSDEVGFDRRMLDRITIRNNYSRLYGPVNIDGDVLFRVVERIRNDNTELAARSLINYQEIMKTFLGIISEFHYMNEYFSIKIHQNSDTEITFDFSKLKEAILILRSSVEQSISMFRGKVPDEIINLYEKEEINGNPNKGSFYWLEENLYRYFIEDPKIKDEKFTLSKMSEIFSLIFNKLTKKRTQRLEILREDDFNIVDVNAGEPYGYVVSGVVYYNASIPNSGIESPRRELIENDFSNLIRVNQSDQRAVPLARVGDRNIWVVPRSEGGRPLGRLTIYNSEIGFNSNNSLMFILNQIVAKTLKNSFDFTNKKILQSIIDSLGGDIFAGSVSDLRSSHPDLMTDALNNFGIRADPKENSLLCTSLAIIISRLMTESLNNQRVFVETSTANMSPFVISQIKSGHPILEKIARNSSSFCETLKQIISRTRINMEKPIVQVRENDISIYIRNSNNAAAVVSSADKAETLINSIEENITFNGNSLHVAQTHEQSRESILSILNTISSKFRNMISLFIESIESVGDISPPSYDLKKIDNKNPFLLISSLAHFLKNNSISLIPDHVHGSSERKLIYVFRSLLKSNPKIELPKWMEERLNEFNNIQTNKLDSEEIKKSVLINLKSVLSILDFINIGSNLTNGIMKVDIFEDRIRNRQLNNPNSVFAFDCSVTETILMAESPNIIDQIQTIGNQIVKLRSDGNERQKERIVTILELNIIPISIHMLMQTIVFSSIYNFSFMFENFICKFLNANHIEVEKLKLETNMNDDDSPKSTNEFILKYIMCPFSEIHQTQYGNGSSKEGLNGYIQRMFRGEEDTIPRDISRELFNKALFGSLFLTDFTNQYSPAGNVSFWRGIGSNFGVVNNNAELLEILQVFRGACFDFKKAEIVDEQGVMRRLFNVMLRTFEVLRERLNPENFRQNNEETERSNFLRNEVVPILNNVIEIITEVQPALLANNNDEYDNIVQNIDRIPEYVEGGKSRFIFISEFVFDVFKENINRILPKLVRFEELTVDVRNQPNRRWLGLGKGIVVNVDPRDRNNEEGSEFYKHSFTYLKDRMSESNLETIFFGENKEFLEEIGRKRFDTIIVRYLVFVTLIQKMMRQTIVNCISEPKNRLVRGLEFLSPLNTEATLLNH